MLFVNYFLKKRFSKYRASFQWWDFDALICGYNNSHVSNGNKF